MHRQGLYSHDGAVHVGIADWSEERRMSARIARLAIGFALVLLADHLLAADSYADSDAARAAEARALRAQIDRMDQDMQALETRLHAYASDPASHTAEADALRAQIHRMDRDQELLEGRLHELETSDPAIAAERFRKPAPADVAQAPQAPVPRMATPAPDYAPTGPALRQAANPAPYEAALDARIAMFRVAMSIYRWVPVGRRELAVFNTYDEAYLLEFVDDCPGLLYASRIEIQNFSTRVRAGEHGVIAAGQRCVIKNIYELRIPRLPKELRP
jgi:hypothetical protein